VGQLHVFKNFAEIKGVSGTWAFGPMVALAVTGVQSSNNIQIKAR
jgi:hypothetical protein